MSLSNILLHYSLKLASCGGKSFGGISETRPLNSRDYRAPGDTRQQKFGQLNKTTQTEKCADSINAFSRQFISCIVQNWLYDMPQALKLSALGYASVGLDGVGQRYQRDVSLAQAYVGLWPYAVFGTKASLHHWLASVVKQSAIYAFHIISVTFRSQVS